MKTTCVDIHATCIRLGRAGQTFGAPPDTGVLLLGASGAGKSDIALRLIAAGATLVADDRVELFVLQHMLWARAPRRGAGLIEVRDVGIVKLPRAARARVGLVVELEQGVRRLPKHRRYRVPATLGLTKSAAPPVIKVAPFEASAAAKIAVAAAAYARNLHRDHINPI